MTALDALPPCPLKNSHDTLIDNAVAFETLIKAFEPHMSGNDVIAVMKEQFQKSKEAAYNINAALSLQTELEKAFYDKTTENAVNVNKVYALEKAAEGLAGALDGAIKSIRGAMVQLEVWQMQHKPEGDWLEAQIDVLKSLATRLKQSEEALSAYRKAVG